MNRPQRRVLGLAALLAALTLVAGLIAGAGSRASAQDVDSHPAHIHTGSCPTPGDVVFPLSNVGPDYAVDGTPSAGSAVGSEAAVPVEVSETTVESSLSDIVGSDHAIVVHESAENIQNYIACGDVGGMMLGSSDLPIGLAPLNDSGYSGVALLHDNGDGTTKVSIFLLESAGAGGAMDDMGSPASGASSSETVSVSIANFAFDPSPLEISAGTTVTWTNNDSAAHTVSQTGGGFESGKLNPGQSFSYTFDTPGTYDYFCQYHANMSGQVIVK